MQSCSVGQQERPKGHRDQRHLPQVRTSDNLPEKEQVLVLPKLRDSVGHLAVPRRLGEPNLASGSSDPASDIEGKAPRRVSHERATAQSAMQHETCKQRGETSVNSHAWQLKGQEARTAEWVEEVESQTTLE